MPVRNNLPIKSSLKNILETKDKFSMFENLKEFIQ
jgi:hypothetical protein